MKGTNLGEFEELVLLVTVARPEEAYSVGIAKVLEEVAGRKVVHSVVHASLNRLVKKGFLTSEMKPGSQKRGGRRKRVFEITSAGMKALEKVKDQRDNLWAMIHST